MQNSGLGNALNPLSSLAHEDVFGIPMLLLIGWRGYPETADEPQHVVMGKSTASFLQTLNIPTFVMKREGLGELAQAAKQATVANGPVALLVPPKFIESLDTSDRDAQRPLMAPSDFIRATIDGACDDAFFFGATGFTARLLVASAEQGNVDEARIFPLVGGMGHTFAVAARFALTKPDLQVICLDGDGGLLMHSGALARASALANTHLVHILLNNGAHQSVGGHPTIAPRFDFSALARNCGFQHVYQCATPTKLRQILTETTQHQGATFIEVDLGADPSMKLPRPTSTPSQMMRNFRASVIQHG
jgi:phosphonopyruvate decarboxylase